MPAAMKHYHTIYTINYICYSLLYRSQYPIASNEWHRVRVSRTARLAFLTVDDQDTQTQMSQGAFDELTANQNMYLGGVPTFRLVSPYIPVRKAFKGCIQKVRSET